MIYIEMVLINTFQILTNNAIHLLITNLVKENEPSKIYFSLKTFYKRKQVTPASWRLIFEPILTLVNAATCFIVENLS